MSYNSSSPRSRSSRRTKCKYCNFWSTDEMTLKKHMTSHTRTYYVTSDNQYQCNKCPFRDSDELLLKYHVGKHLRSSRFHKCRYCSFSSIAKSGLKNHQRTHMMKKVESNTKENTCNTDAVIELVDLTADGVSSASDSDSDEYNVENVEHYNIGVDKYASISDDPLKFYLENDVVGEEYVIIE